MSSAVHPPRGFTLPELLTAIAVASIMAAFAAPSFSNMLQDQRLSNDTSQLITALNFARTEASRRRRTMTLCPSTNGTACTGTNWEVGYIVFVNQDADSPGVVDAGEEVVRIVEAAGTNVTVRADTFASSLSYAPSGFSTAAGTFTLCDARGATRARGVLVNAVGRPRRAEDTNSDGTEEDRSGNNLSC